MRTILPFLIASATSVIAAEDLPRTAKDFASSGKLDEFAVRLFIADRQQTPVGKLVKPRSKQLDSGLLENETADWFATMTLRAGKNPPYTIAEADSLMPLPRKEETPTWTKVKGLTEPHNVAFKDPTKAGILGPLRLRKDLSEVLKSPADAKGAKIAYADNHNKGDNGAWNSQGAIYYPLIFENRAFQLEAGLAGEWTVAEVDGPKATPTSPGDVQELTPSIPFTFRFDAGRNQDPIFRPNSAELADNRLDTYSSEWQIQGKPFVNTDFSFDHQIYGLSASARYVGYVFDSPIYLGKFQNFSQGQPGSWIVDSKLRYQITLMPTLDYSTVEADGPHTTRVEGDYWTRVGGLAGLEIAFGGEKTPFTMGASYQFFDTVGGTGGYSYLWKSSLTWWFSQYAGISLEHQVGETPIAAEELEQTTLGFEVKY